jgi:hypothetical protein
MPDTFIRTGSDLSTTRSVFSIAAQSYSCTSVPPQARQHSQSQRYCVQRRQREETAETGACERIFVFDASERLLFALFPWEKVCAVRKKIFAALDGAYGLFYRVRGLWCGIKGKVCTNNSAW